MTDLNLTPGISYRDYVQDALVYTGSTSEQDPHIKAEKQTVYGGAWSAIGAASQETLKNIQTNRLRETFVSETVWGFRFILEIDSDGYNHAGIKGELESDMVGLFNFISTRPGGAGTRAPILMKIETEYFDGATTLTQTVNNELMPNVVENSRYNLAHYITFNPLAFSRKRKITITLTPHNDVLPFQFTLGRLWIGNFMTVCFESDWSITLDNPSQINYSAGLDAHPVEQRRRRRGSFPIENILHSNAITTIADIDTQLPFNSFSDMQLQTGKDYPLVVSHRRERNETYPDRIYPDPYALFGLMSKDMSLQHVSGPLYQTQIDVVELI